ncbi:TlpA family protein disulfide reductase [Aquabacterium lacunae]|jgi:peroxiredoxin|uniref:TlpA family protein disulfide reductase n=1 Tax=Aquabacterium lacunae TaxID=2528630 RepID=A0A4V2JFI9_9BURK|nr:TlpA disulfide reductase family protein [Aquabacterium lacunae]TBO30200.1 TlpA family protein disulfide reductase [Aquabacterium lacunae]
MDRTHVEHLPCTRRHWLALTAVAPLALSACSQDQGSRAPDVPFTQLDGKVVPMADLQGKVTLVNFWATSCSTCIKEMPELVATHQKFQARGFETLAVAMSYDPPAYVMQFAESRQLPFRVAIDHSGDLAKGFGDVQLTPTTFLLDKQGRIVKRYVGAPDFAAMHQLIDKLLKA